MYACTMYGPIYHLCSYEIRTTVYYEPRTGSYSCTGINSAYSCST
eukprot:COSAG01_NODE_1050_length_11922_cov_8.014632_17_plen_45_part_00